MTTAGVSIAEEIDPMIEERGEENHLEPWLRFGEAPGLTRPQNIETELPPETPKLADTYREITKQGTFAQAAAALYCYESQMPEVAKTKIVGLKEFHGVEEYRGLPFFDVHIGADGSAHAPEGAE